MKVRIMKIEECVGGISICVQYHEPEDHLSFFNLSGMEEQHKKYIGALNEFDKDIKKLHIGDMMKLIHEGTSQEGYTFEEILDMMNDEKEREKVRAAVKKHHMENVYNDIKGRERRERRKMRDCK